MDRKTKIVATLGPASSSEATLRELIRAGIDVARLNFSHGTREGHLETCLKVRRIAGDLGRPVGVLADLQGPKIRIGDLKGDAPITLEEGDRFTITTRKILGKAGRVSTTYPGLAEDLKPGDPVLLDEGLLRLRVERISGADVVCRVERGGLLHPRKGINLPGVPIGTPSLTAKDREDLQTIAEAEFDFAALSFVRTERCIREARGFLAERKADLPLIAKIEKPEALDNLEEILEAADGVMVARGDLGVELSVEKVPAAQKRIIRLANRMDKTVITATQMLESMRFNPIPTRAEASDVANAIFDGSDAVMLSAETASGRYPAESVRTMHKIAVEAEAETGYEVRTPPRSQDSSTFAGAVCDAAFRAAEDTGAGFLVVETLTGRTARLLSKFRPRTPIIGLTSDPKAMRRMTLYHNVIPIFRPKDAGVEETVDGVDRDLKARGWVKPGDVLVFTFGLPLSGEGHTNALRLHTVR